MFKPNPRTGCNAMLRSLVHPSPPALWLLLARRSAARGHRSSCHGTAATAAAAGQPAKRIAVVGGGFAGLAVCWHLLAASRASKVPLQLQLFDAHGLGAGGSGAAAGLLHPYTPRGKMLWRGLEAFQDAVQLLEAAEAAVAAAVAAEGSEGAGAAAGSSRSSQRPRCAATPAGIRQPFAWRHGMLRPARSTKQARDIARFLPADAVAAAATGAEAVTDAAALAALVPGLQPELLLPPEPEPEQQAAAERLDTGSSGTGPSAEQRRAQKQRQQQQQQRQQSPAVTPALGLMVHSAVTIHPASYMRALWLACQQLAGEAGDSAAARLTQRQVSSLAQLQAADGPFDAVVVAAGAAVGSIAELAGVLPLELCHGYSVDMCPASSSSCIDSSSGSSSNDSNESGSEDGTAAARIYPAGAPSLLGSPYIAAHGSSSLVVGATKRYGLTPAEALAQCARPVVTDASEAAAASGALLPAAQQLWPPLEQWQVETVRAGVRALPARGSDGSIPYAGRLPTSGSRHSHAGTAAAAPEGQQQQQQVSPPPLPDCWVIGGLGARGLVYHAWLGKLVAQAALVGSEEGLPPELLRWREQPEPEQ